MKTVALTKEEAQVIVEALDFQRDSQLDRASYTVATLRRDIRRKIAKIMSDDTMKG